MKKRLNKEQVKLTKAITVATWPSRSTDFGISDNIDTLQLSESDYAIVHNVYQDETIEDRDLDRLKAIRDKFIKWLEDNKLAYNQITKNMVYSYHGKS